MLIGATQQIYNKEMNAWMNSEVILLYNKGDV